jgi:dihydroxyacetone kinase
VSSLFKSNLCARGGLTTQELGLGIHGEPGAFKGPLRPANEVVRRMLDTITAVESGYLPLQVRELTPT